MSASALVELLLVEPPPPPAAPVHGRCRSPPAAVAYLFQHFVPVVIEAYFDAVAAHAAHASLFLTIPSVQTKAETQRTPRPPPPRPPPT